MNLQTPAQRIAVLGIVVGLLAVIALASSWIVTSNITSLGHWLDKRSPAIWGFLIGAVPSIAAYLFGKGAGKKEGKTEGLIARIGRRAKRERMRGAHVSTVH